MSTFTPLRTAASYCVMSRGMVDRERDHGAPNLAEAICGPGLELTGQVAIVPAVRARPYRNLDRRTGREIGRVRSPRKGRVAAVAGDRRPRHGLHRRRLD